MAVTGPGLKKEKFIGSTMAEDGTGKEVAKAVISVTSPWNIFQRVVALSYDTCSVNTGTHLGKN